MVVNLGHLLFDDFVVYRARNKKIHMMKYPKLYNASLTVGHIYVGASRDALYIHPDDEYGVEPVYTSDPVYAYKIMGLDITVLHLLILPIQSRLDKQAEILDWISLYHRLDGEYMVYFEYDGRNNYLYVVEKDRFVNAVNRVVLGYIRDNKPEILLDRKRVASVFITTPKEIHKRFLQTVICRDKNGNEFVAYATPYTYFFYAKDYEHVSPLAYIQVNERLGFVKIK